MDDFKNPESVDSAKVAKIGHLMKGMGRDYLSKLPMEALEGAKDMLANISFAPAEAREILGKIKGKVRLCMRTVSSKCQCIFLIIIHFSLRHFLYFMIDNSLV